MKKTIYGIWKISLVFLMFIFSSCDYVMNSLSEEVAVVVKKDKQPLEEKEPPVHMFNERKWNIFMYMSADNNLESAAIEDLYELECSKLDVEEVSIFALVDRSAAYDTSENNWSGTRLYKIKSKKNDNERKLISEEIPCEDLGLEPGLNTELDMSSGYVLSRAITFIMEKYPAENYGFIMWGHGTGWRNDSNSVSKGFAYDETSKTYMTLKQLGDAIKNGLNDRRFDFIGFDTCFGGELEIMYELKDYANFCTASEGLVMSSGWNYTTLFNQFQRCQNKTPQELCQCITEQFKKQYENTPRASIVTVQMNKIQNYYDAFNQIAQAAADLIKNKDSRNKTMGLLYSNKNPVGEKYTFGSEKSDIYLDVSSVVEALAEAFPGKLDTQKDKFKQCEGEVFVSSWAQDRVTGGLGVYFSSLTESKLLVSVHPGAYIKDKTYDQIAFIRDGEGYVPTKDCSGSLLDKLFYTNF